MSHFSSILSLSVVKSSYNSTPPIAAATDIYIDFFYLSTALSEIRMTSAESQKSDEKLCICDDCDAMLPASSFSRTQLRKKAMRCKECIYAIAVPHQWHEGVNTRFSQWKPKIKIEKPKLKAHSSENQATTIESKQNDKETLMLRKIGRLQQEKAEQLKQRDLKEQKVEELIQEIYAKQKRSMMQLKEEHAEKLRLKDNEIERLKRENGENSKERGLKQREILKLLKENERQKLSMVKLEAKNTVKLEKVQKEIERLRRENVEQNQVINERHVKIDMVKKESFVDEVEEHLKRSKKTKCVLL